MKMRHNVSQISTPENNDPSTISDLNPLGTSIVASRNITHLH